jgi:fatty-acid desaturase
LLLNYFFLLGLLVGFTGQFGVTAGVHRYYTHKSFKAKIPLQIILLACYSVAGQVIQTIIFNILLNKFN